MFDFPYSQKPLHAGHMSGYRYHTVLANHLAVKIVWEIPLARMQVCMQNVTKVASSQVLVSWRPGVFGTRMCCSCIRGLDWHCATSGYITMQSCRMHFRCELTLYQVHSTRHYFRNHQMITRSLGTRLDSYGVLDKV